MEILRLFEKLAIYTPHRNGKHFDRFKANLAFFIPNYLARYCMHITVS